jgi:putative endonuclease
MYWSIYALVSINRNWIYVGISDNLQRRFHEHASGWEKTTAPYRPFYLLELASSQTRGDARIVEKWYKTGYGKEVIRNLIRDGYPFHGGMTSLSADR